MNRALYVYVGEFRGCLETERERERERVRGGDQCSAITYTLLI